MILEEQATLRLKSKALKMHQQLLAQNIFRPNKYAKRDTLVQKSAMKALEHGIQIVAGEKTS